MFSVHISTTGTSSQGTMPRNTACLDRLCLAAYEYGLGYLWKDFESRLPDLLVATEGRVGVAIAGRDQIQWATTPGELRTALGEGQSTLL